MSVRGLFFRVCVSAVAALLSAGVPQAVSAPHGADSIAVEARTARAAKTRHGDRRPLDRRAHVGYEGWERIIPTHVKVQYAGGMGFMSAGVGWDYGRRKQWETHLLFGFLPRYGSSRAKTTMTVKENFIPWSVALGDRWAVEPLSVGLYINTVFGPEFWRSQPARYPKGYYFMSTKMRLNVFVGQRVELTLPRNRRKFVKGITAFYELSTCDLYLRALVLDSHVKLTDIFGLSLGLKFQVF